MHVTKEEVDMANSVNILDYLHSIGEPLKQEGSYFRHAEHDSLVINGKRNYFSWNSRGISGTAVTFLMSVKNMKFQEAVKQINNDAGIRGIEKYIPKEPEYPEKFDYNVKETTNTSDIRRYLVDERKIDPEIVDNLIRLDYIAQDINRNIVFKWKDDKKNIIGANLQGTRIIPEEKRINPDRKYFKHILRTTKDATFSGFSITKGYPENLYYFESSVDMLSYLSLNRRSLNNCRLESMDGLKYKNLLMSLHKTNLKLEGLGRDIKSINLCVDNDDAGREFIKKASISRHIRKDGQKVEMKADIPELPKGLDKWDWNDELKSTKQLKKKLTNKMEI